jgi:hypothetical protein
MSDMEILVDRYVKLRDAIRDKDAEYKKIMRPYREKLDEMNGIILGRLNEIGADNVRTAAGTAYRKIERSVTIADKEAFRRHVIGSEAWELLDWRANQTAVTALVEEGLQPPPGVNYSTTMNVGIRRASEKE